MKSSEFSITIAFDDGSKVSLGDGDDLYVEPAEGAKSAILNDERLNLIRNLRDAENNSVED